MLTRALRLTASLFLVLAASLVASIPANADATGTCTGISQDMNGCSSAVVTVIVTVDGQAIETTLTSDAAVVCRTTWGNSVGQPMVVPCETSDGWWSGSRNCYVKASNPQPPLTSPAWQGQTIGKIYDCTLPSGVAGPTITFWSDTPPVSTAQVAQLVARAVQTLGLTAIDIGMAPTPTSIDPNSIGIVGLPNWMWVKNPSPRTYGPAVGSASSGGVTVTVTAKVDRVTWTMGDGTAPIVCTTAGTPYAASYGAAPSPDCGHTPGYQKQGTYQVTAVSHWTISYSSNVGIGGTLAMNLTRSSSLTVGELQAAVVPGR